MINKILYAAFVIMATMLLGACSKTESYSELLNDQQKACNWYLSQHKVEVNLPTDDDFIVGEDAPFYKLDEEGSVYMQIVRIGDLNNRPSKGDVVYFRFKRMNIKNFYEYGTESWEGNSDDLNTMGATRFVYGDYDLPSTVKYGEGIQWPLKYVGYDSEVNLVLKSLEGFASDQSACLPYLINIKYFQAEY